MRKFRRSIVFAGLASFSIITSSLLTGCGATSAPTSSEPVPVVQSQSTAVTSSTSANEDTVTVSATGKISIVPDMAEISFGVSTEDVDAKAAQDKNREEIIKVIDKLKELGISEGSIKTSACDIRPQYDYDSEGGNRTVGYTVDTTLTVSGLKVTDAGNIISQCVEAGINSMNGINYSCSTYDNAYEDALKKAVDAANEKADALAGASGRNLGNIKTITEGYQNMSLQYRPLETAVFKNSTASTDAVIMPGESDVEAQVTITYALS